MKVTLVFAKGKLAGQSIPITDKQYIIGRHRDCEMCVKSNQISVHHCAILVQKDKALVRDFESTNGTFINDTRIAGDRELQHGDVLRVGSVVLQVRLEADALLANPAAKPGSLSETDAAAVIHDGSALDIEKGILDVSRGSIYEMTDLQPLPPLGTKPPTQPTKKK